MSSVKVKILADTDENAINTFLENVTLVEIDTTANNIIIVYTEVE